MTNVLFVDDLAALPSPYVLHNLLLNLLLLGIFSGCIYEAINVASLVHLLSLRIKLLDVLRDPLLPPADLFLFVSQR